MDTIFLNSTRSLSEEKSKDSWFIEMKTTRYTIEFTEDMELKLQVLCGKKFLNPRDLQQTIQILIDKAYENRKR